MSTCYKQIASFLSLRLSEIRISLKLIETGNLLRLSSIRRSSTASRCVVRRSVDLLFCLNSERRCRASVRFGGENSLFRRRPMLGLSHIALGWLPTLELVRKSRETPQKQANEKYDICRGAWRDVYTCVVEACQ